MKIKDGADFNHLLVHKEKMFDSNSLLSNGMEVEHLGQLWQKILKLTMSAEYIVSELSTK